MKIEELKPYQKKIELVVKVVSKAEPKEVKSRWDSSSHRMTEALVGDETGTVLLTLWDDSIDALEDGKTYVVSNAYTTLFKDSLRLNTGRFGEIQAATEEISTVNTENKMSKDIEPKPEQTEQKEETKTEEVAESTVEETEEDTVEEANSDVEESEAETLEENTEESEEKKEETTE